MTRALEQARLMLVPVPEEAEAPPDGPPADDQVLRAMEGLTSLFGRTEGTHGTKGERMLHLAKVMGGQTPAPHLLFMTLAQELARRHCQEYPVEFGHVRALCATLSPPALPLAYCTAVFLPLFVPRFFEVNVPLEVQGETHEVAKYCLSMHPFCGFAFKGGSDSACVPWDGLDESLNQSVEVPLDVSSTACAVRLCDTSKKIRECCRGTDEWQRALRAEMDEWEMAVYGCVTYMSLSPLHQTVRRFFGTALGTALLQSQVSLMTPRWTVNDLLDNCFSEEQTLTKVKELCGVRCAKLESTLNMFPTHAFNAVNVDSAPVERAAESGGGGGGGNRMFRVEYLGTPGTASEAVAALNGHFKMELINFQGREANMRKIMQYGLWSTYNSTECSEWGNLNNRPPEQADNKPLRAMLDELTPRTCRQWCYEFKTTPVNEPGNMLAWFYNARLGLLSTVGGAQAAVADLDPPAGKAPTERHDLLLKVTAELCREATRGVLARVKNPGGGGTGLTFQLCAGVLSSRANAVTRSLRNVSTVKSQEFRNLDWYRPSPEDTERIKHLTRTFNVRQLLLRLSQEMDFFYKRPHWLNPRGVLIKNGRVVQHKRRYVNAPAAFLACHSMVQVNSDKWFTSGVESRDPWSKINVYAVAIDTNDSCYSESTRLTWSQPGEYRAKDVAWLDIVNGLLEDAGESAPVTTSQMNNFAMSRAVFTTVVEHLRGMGRYHQDCEPEYQEPPAGEEGDEDLGGDETAAAKLAALPPPAPATLTVRAKRPLPAAADEEGAAGVLSTLEQSLLKRQRMYE